MGNFLRGCWRALGGIYQFVVDLVRTWVEMGVYLFQEHEDALEYRRLLALRRFTWPVDPKTKEDIQKLGDMLEQSVGILEAMTVSIPDTSIPTQLETYRNRKAMLGAMVSGVRLMDSQYEQLLTNATNMVRRELEELNMVRAYLVICLKKRHQELEAFRLELIRILENKQAR